MDVMDGNGGMRLEGGGEEKEEIVTAWREGGGSEG